MSFILYTAKKIKVTVYNIYFSVGIIEERSFIDQLVNSEQRDEMFAHLIIPLHVPHCECSCSVLGRLAQLEADAAAVRVDELGSSDQRHGQPR